MKVVTAEEMRRLDALAQTQFGIGGFALMSEAGKAIAAEVEKAYRPEKICVVCGKGNNAGDGFIVAREFHKMGRAVTVVCLEEPGSYTDSARTAWEQLSKTKVTMVDRHSLKQALTDCDLIVDALLGTGLRGSVREPYASVIHEINSAEKSIVAVDVPSGLRDLEPGEEAGAIVNADLTVTIGLPKVMLLSPQGLEHAGRVVTASINFPPDLLTGDNLYLNQATPSEIAQWLPKRIKDSNKGTYGHVGIIGSAITYAGATVLTARAALRAGCGLATIYTLPAANAIYKTALPEATSVLIQSGSETHMDEAAGEQIKQVLKEHSVLAVGPGLGQGSGTKVFFTDVLEAWHGPLVIDADGLNLLSDGLLCKIKGRTDTLLTPHPGEMSRLTGKAVQVVQDDRVNVVRAFAVEHGVTVLLKGAGTLVGRPDGQVWLIPGAEAALAKGGTGDVLTGAISAIIAQGAPVWQAAIIAATAHLQAGKQCALRYGSRGVVASDVADEIPLVLDQFTLNESSH